VLQFAADGTLELAHQPPAAAQRMKPWSIDFLRGELARRGKQASTELLVRAMRGSGSAPANTVVDLTAGAGRDAFLLACAGHRVLAVERSPVLAALLADAVRRLRLAEAPGAQGAGHRMSVVCADSAAAATQAWLAGAARRPAAPPLPLLLSAADDAETAAPAGQPERVPMSVSAYVDPMYPEGAVGRRAAVGKHSQMLRLLAAPVAREDAALLAAALRIVRAGSGAGRAVIKRPKAVPPLPGEAPSGGVQGSTHRFDIYT